MWLMQEPTTRVQNTAERCWNDTGKLEEHIHVRTLGIKGTGSSINSMTRVMNMSAVHSVVHSSYVCRDNS